MSPLIHIDFQIDELVLNEEKAADLSTIDAAELRETWFVMPVRFGLQGAELLELPTAGPARVWVADARTNTLRVEEHAPQPTPWLYIPLLRIGIRVFAGSKGVVPPWAPASGTRWVPGGGW